MIRRGLRATRGSRNLWLARQPAAGLAAQRGSCCERLVVGANSGRRRAHSEHWAEFPLGAAALGGGLCLANLLFQGNSSARCEERSSPPVAADRDVRVVTYNVLSPPLCTAKFFPKCDPEDVEAGNRLPKVLRRLEAEVGSQAIVALQEVDLSWSGKLHAFFAERGYCAVFAQYGSAFTGYMGVMLAWPRDAYEVLDIELCRLSDTAPKSTWAKSGKSSGLSPFGIFTYNGLQEVLGCRPPEFPSDDFEWRLAQDRHNEAIFAKLRPRDAPQSSFVVSTYHMPCFFGPPQKVRVVNIHTYLLLKRLRDFAGNDPSVLMGDFNFKPGDSAYSLARSGGEWEAALEATNGNPPAEIEGLRQRLPKEAAFPGGMKSAYCTFHKKEPLFTNFAYSAGSAEDFVDCLDYIWYTPGGLTVVDCPKLPQSREEVKGPFPNKKEPSDHLPLSATLRLRAAS